MNVCKRLIRWLCGTTMHQNLRDWLRDNPGATRCTGPRKWFSQLWAEKQKHNRAMGLWHPFPRAFQVDGVLVSPDPSVTEFTEVAPVLSARDHASRRCTATGLDDRQLALMASDAYWEHPPQPAHRIPRMGTRTHP